MQLGRSVSPIREQHTPQESFLQSLDLTPLRTETEVSEDDDLKALLNILSEPHKVFSAKQSLSKTPDKNNGAKNSAAKIVPETAISFSKESQKIGLVERENRSLESHSELDEAFICSVSQLDTDGLPMPESDSSQILESEKSFHLETTILKFPDKKRRFNKSFESDEEQESGHPRFGVKTPKLR